MQGSTPVWMRLLAIGILVFLVANWYFRLLDPVLVLLIALAFVVLGRSSMGKSALAGPRWIVFGALMLLGIAIYRMLSG